MRKLILYISIFSLLVFAGCNVLEFEYRDGPTLFTVTYNGNSNDTGSVPVEAAYYSFGKTLKVAHNTGGMTKAGLDFLGWNTSADGSGTAYLPGETLSYSGTDLVLYARWGLMSLTYKGNGSDSGAVPAQVTGQSHSDLITVDGNSGNLTKTGYHFIGWNTEADGSGFEYHSGSDLIFEYRDIVLYAQWSTKAVHSLTYDGNGNIFGSVPAGVEYYEEGHAATVLGNSQRLYRTGSTFTGWNTAADGGGTHYPEGYHISMDQDVILYAQWIGVSSYSISYTKNGADSGTVPRVHSYRIGDTVTIAGNTGNLTRAGYHFAGWNANSDGSGDDYPEHSQIVMPGPLDLYAKWVGNVYTITYDGNGNDSGTVPVASHGYEAGSQVFFADNTGGLSRTGYRFNGWNTQADGLGTNYPYASPYPMPASDTTLYARWVNVYRVTYSGNGNTGGSAPLDTKVHLSTDTVTVLDNTSSLTKSGSTFIGWNTSADGTGTDRGAGSTFTMGAGDVVLYAKWSAQSTITISGNVSDALTGNPLSGVNIDLDIGGVTYNDTSDASGDYSLTGIPGNIASSYHVSYSLAGYYDAHQDSAISHGLNLPPISLSPDSIPAGSYRFVANREDPNGNDYDMEITSKAGTTAINSDDASKPATVTVDTTAASGSEIFIFITAENGDDNPVIRVYDSSGLISVLQSSYAGSSGWEIIWGTFILKKENNIWKLMVDDKYLIAAKIN